MNNSREVNYNGTNTSHKWHWYYNRIILNCVCMAFTCFIFVLCLHTYRDGSNVFDILWTLLDNASSTIITACTIGILWEVSGKNDLIQEIQQHTDKSLRDAGLSNTLADQGILHTTMEFKDGIRWKKYIADADEIDVCWWAGSEWLRGNTNAIKTAIKTRKGSVIGCKQFSCSGDAVRRLIMGCRRMLSVEDRAAIMAGLEAGLSQTRIAHLIGRSPSVVCREIARHRGPGGVYQAEDAGRAAQVARRRPKKRLLDRDEILRRRVIFDLSQGRTPRQISGRLSVEACGTVAPMDNSPHAQGRTISHEAIYTWIYAHPKKTLIEHGVCLPSRRWMRKKPPAGGRTPPIVGMRLIDERPDIADRMIPGNWEGDLIIGKDGASACATLVERTTRYLIIVALPLGRRADQVCDALTRRIQGLPEGAMRTLTWDQGREMARHQRLTQDTGVEVFFAHPHSPWERGTNENTNRLIRRYLPKGTPITSHQPYLDAIAYELNNCPRATLGYRTPTEAFNQLIATTH